MALALAPRGFAPVDLHHQFVDEITETVVIRILVDQFHKPDLAEAAAEIHGVVRFVEKRQQGHRRGDGNTDKKAEEIYRRGIQPPRKYQRYIQCKQGQASVQPLPGDVP